MATPDDQSTPSSLPLAPVQKKENITPIGSRINELKESRAELFTRIQGLKQDLQNWRLKLDTQVKIYREELTELKSSLNVEVEQLRSEFQELRSTLQQQQEDVAASLRSLGLKDGPGEVKAGEDNNVEVNDEELITAAQEETDKQTEN